MAYIEAISDTAKEEQTKSVTATTSTQTVNPDTGKVLSSVTVNPQVHSATYTPTGYSNANDMGAQNNYRYVDTSAYEPTSITPSYLPESLSSGSIYRMGGNGYLIGSNYFDVKTPTDTPQAISYSNSYFIATNNGYVVKECPDVTPSDSSPATLTSGKNYHMTSGGYAIESELTSITPSDSSPVSLSSSGIYKPSTSGYAIKNSPASKTPSDTSPASVASGDIIKPSAAGYLVKTVSNLGGTPDKTYSNDSAPSSGSVDITVTQKPRYIILGLWHRANAYQGLVGIIDVTKSKGYRMGYFSSAVSGDWTNYTSYFPTISSSKVTYSYAAFAGASRVKIMIYY